VEINKEKKNQKKSAERTKCSGKKKARPSGRNRKKKLRTGKRKTADEQIKLTGQNGEEN
jgi:hypothetical protein